MPEAAVPSPRWAMDVRMSRSGHKTLQRTSSLQPIPNPHLARSMSSPPRDELVVGRRGGRRQEAPRRARGGTEPSFQSVALVFCSTGIIGTSLLDILPRDDTLGGQWKVCAVSRRAPCTWSTPLSSPAVTHLQLDLARAWPRHSGRSPMSPTSRGRATRLTTRIGRSTLACSATCSSWHFVQLWSAPS